MQSKKKICHLRKFDKPCPAEPIIELSWKLNVQYKILQ